MNQNMACITAMQLHMALKAEIAVVGLRPPAKNEYLYISLHFVLIVQLPFVNSYHIHSPLLAQVSNSI